MTDVAPLILTLAFDEPTLARFDGERRRYFPEALNRIPAHATLFHHLPGDRERGVIEAITALARTVPAPDVVVTGLRFTGRGVAYVLESESLATFRARLAREFGASLTAQDRQGWRPHVTVQNKVSPDAARALHADLSACFAPFHFTAPATLLWRYLGGPWAPVARLPFGENA
ncbi:2'-5' RNA ligase family protein [Methylobacterium sp. J-070]|uniref:2'-5' RNA ligase family protein n=1 Tax=Methylobacterium sp. J-070 TaxID=2836650 RepID=UPI001FBB8DC2|nr:2'-5' RNA ligase family protein [Methylobacterium sp. J-070]MCJ2049012.1 2'-5' RNA ligase family protein [Methylobacterium sp. J-070]